jgi:hypothetical protein
MTTTPAHASPRHDGNRTVLTALLWISVVATFLTAVAVAWYQVSFQLFGDVADHGDYAMAAGMYGFGAFLLALTPVVAALRLLPLGSSVAAAAGFFVLVTLSGHAAHLASVTSSRSVADESWPAGTVFLALFPWVWALPVMTLVAAVTRVGSRSWDSRSTSAT